MFGYGWILFLVEVIGGFKMIFYPDNKTCDYDIEDEREECEDETF